VEHQHNCHKGFNRKDTKKFIINNKVSKTPSKHSTGW